MKENFALRLKDLRTKKGITQQELANSLDVTAKAVSKWENDGGMPDISMFPKLAQIFATTIDFLMTGEENSKPLSPIELCAKRNSVSLYEDIPENKLFIKDDTGKHLLDYIIKYDAYNILLEVYNNKQFERFINLDINRSKYSYNIHNRNKIFLNHPRYSSILKIALISNSKEFIKFLDIKSQFIGSNANNIEKITIDDFKAAIKHSNLNEMTLEYLLEKDSKNKIWVDGYKFLIKFYLELNDISKLTKVLNAALQNNTETKKLCDKIILEDNDAYGLAIKFNSKNGEYTRTRLNNSFIGQAVIISEESITSALDKRLFEIVTLMNEINKNTNKNTNTYIAEQYEIDSRKISDDKNLSDLEKKKKLISYGGIIKIDDLISLDDYKVYKELIELPASEIERAFEFIKEENFKQLMEYANKNDYKELINNIHTFDKDLLSRILAKSYKPETTYFSYGGSSSSLLKKGHPNYDYYYISKEKDNLPYKDMTMYERLVIRKKVIKFNQIINHKDIRFFDHAIKTDTENLDWALENVDPKRFDVIKKLLDAGAKLHKRWTEDDGWGYMVDRDEIDKIGTEILIKKINEIMEGKNE